MTPAIIAPTAGAIDVAGAAGYVLKKSSPSCGLDRVKLYDENGRGLLWSKSGEEFVKPGEWNEMTVEGHGPHVVVHVNGTKASEINDPSIRMKGPFALQIHGGQDVEVGGPPVAAGARSGR